MAEAALGHTVYFDHPGVAVVTWDPTLEAVHVEWQGWASSSEREACLDAGHRALTEHHAARWLVDGRAMKAIKQADQDWIDRSWFPRVLAAGLRKMAMVVPKSSLAMMNVQDILNRVPDPRLDVAYFVSVEEAREWLAASS